MKLVLKGVSTRVDISDGTSINLFDFIDEDGPEGNMLQVPVSGEAVQFLLEAINGGPQPPEEEESEEEPEEEFVPAPRPPPAPPKAPAFQSVRKRMAAGGSDDGVQPL